MYKIKVFRRLRRKTEHIIIVQAKNLRETNQQITPEVLRGTYRYTWGIWQQYFLTDLVKDALPCHYFAELLDRDYVVYKGLNDYKPSYYVEDLVRNNIIESKYKNSILIVLGEDFELDVLEKRLSDHLCDKVIVPLLREYKLDFTRVKLLDECLTENWEDNLKMSDLKYDIHTHKYFDMNTIKMSITRYERV